MNKRHVAQLSLFLFGSPRIELAGKPVAVDTRKALALLAYLAITRQAHSRDALAALLWPDYDQSHAYAALRRTLSALNKAIGGQGLVIERETIGWNDQAGVWIDVEQFQQHLTACQQHDHAENEVCARCLKPLTQAAELYREDFLAGFSLRDSGNFDDWAFFQTEHLRRELVGALDRLVRYLSAQHDYAAALAHARRWIAIDPLHEPAHRELMKLYALTGQRAAALRQYQDCVRVLKQELDVEPLAETTQLFEAIKANQIRLARQPRPMATNPQPLTIIKPYPLVGRTLELETLRQMYAQSGAGRFVALEGEAGIGKTRLAEEFINQVRDQTTLIITARCYEGEVILPYGLFVDLLRAVIAQSDRSGQLDRLPAVWLSEAARLAPELSGLRSDLPFAPPLAHPGAQGRFFEGITQVLLSLCTPAILFLDDLNWIDEASLDLLQYFLRRLRGHVLLIIAAWRIENVPAEHRLRTVASELTRTGVGKVLDLTPLTQSQVEELTLASHVAAGIAERLHRETDGLPYFVIEYLEALRAQPDSAWSIPRNVRDLLLSRLRSVSAMGRQLLQTAVIIGRSFELDTLRVASGRSDEETVVALEELIGQRLIRESVTGDVPPSPQYDFGHEKMREVIYEDTSLARRRLLHQRVAQALIVRQRSQRDDALAGPIAQHYQWAGWREEAAEYFFRAGEYARSLYAHAEALAHYQAALTAGYTDAALIHERLGDLHTLRGEYRAALQSYETAAALEHTEVTALARLEHRIGNVYQRQGERDLAESHYQTALNLSGSTGDPILRVQIYNDASLNAQHFGQFDRAVDLANQALALAQTADDRRSLAQAHNVLGVLSRHCRDDATALYHLQHSLALAESLDDPIARMAALNNLALVYADRDDVDQAIGLTQQALALCQTLGDRHHAAALHNNLADLLHAAHRHEEAMFHLKEAVTILAEIGMEAGNLQPEIWKLTEW